MTTNLRARLTENKHELVDSLYLFLLQGVNKFLPLLVLPYVLRVLGAEGYAYVGFSLAVVQCAVLVIDFGFDLSATKSVALAASDRTRLTSVFWSVVWAKTALLFLSLFAILIVSLSVPVFRDYWVAVCCTLPMAVGSAYTFMWLFQGIGRVRQMAVINTLSKLLLLPLIFLFVRSSSDYLLAALIQSGVFLLTALLSCWWLWRLRVVGPPVFRRRAIREELAASWPLFLSRASTSVYTQFFVLILGFFCLKDAIGRYTAAEALMRAACFVLYVPLTQAFFPRISALSATDRPLAMRTFRNVRWMVFVAMASISLVLFVGAPYVSRFLGADYAGIVTLLRVMAPAPLFIGLGAVYGQMGLVALGDERSRRQFRNVYFLVAVAALALVAILAPLWHEMGAAFALLLSEMLVFLLMAAAFRRRSGERKEGLCC